MATATAAVGLAGGAAKFFEGRSMQKKAERFIDNFEWQDLENPYKDLQVSTLGSDLRTEQANIGAATTTEALRSGGARGLANLAKVEAQRNLTNREIAADLDEQQKKIDYSAAGQDVVNQNMVEKRQEDELAGYGQMMNVGMGMKSQGIDNAVNAVGAFGQGAGGQKMENKLWGIT